MESKIANFGIGQVIHHRTFNYRGVIFDIDPEFQGSEEWYEKNISAESDTSYREEPWYHVLIDQDGKVAYVPESNLEVDQSTDPVEHPLIENFFASFNGVNYQTRHAIN